MSGALDAGSFAVLEWEAWPARERPGTAIATLGVLIVVSVLMAGIGGHVVFGLAAVVVLLGSLNPFFVPTRFRLDGETLEACRWPVRKVRRWEDIRAGYADARGLTLSPLAGRPWLEPYRAVRLLFSGNRREVLAFVRGRLGEGVRIVELAPKRDGAAGA